MLGERGSWVGVCVPLTLSLSFENSELNCSKVPTLRSEFFEILKFVSLSEVAHMSCYVKFSSLTTDKAI